MKLSPVHGIAALLVIFSSSVAYAQSGEDVSSRFSGMSTVSGSGMVSLKRKPELMRLQIALLGKAGSLKEALSILKDRSEAAKLQLVAMGAAKESITIDDPELSSTKSNEQEQLEMMLQQQMRARGRRGQKKEATTAPVTVSAMLTAQWPLKAKTTEEMLIEVHELQKKVEDADLAGLKDASKLSPEEQELLEEMEGISMSSFGSEGESKPGEPIFSFVSVVSPEEHDQALADAFQKAKLQAARLAKAAGAKLGTLQSINGSRDQSDDFINYGGYGYNQYAYQLLQGAFESEEEWDEDKLEALGVKPGKVTYTIRVRASFELKSP